MGYLKSAVKGSLEFIEYGGKGVASAVTSFYAMPSAVRKYGNEELLFIGDRENDYTNAEAVGFGLGFCSGMCVDYAIAGASIDEASKGNYMPLVILGGLNACSLVIEGGRLLKRRFGGGDGLNEKVDG